MAIVEVLALAGAVTKIAGSISSAVKAGKDMNAVLPHFGKLAKLEADINLAESGKHRGFLGRLTSTEADAFEIASAKMAHRQAQADLQSVCRLYGPSGMWDLVVRNLILTPWRSCIPIGRSGLIVGSELPCTITP